jgi:hypothetical protein
MSVQLRSSAEDLMRRGATPVVSTTGSGMARGTRVMTALGPVAVEDLVPGDRLVTRERGLARLRGITRFHGKACTISRDSFGRAKPARRTVVAEGQHIVLRDWRAKALFGATVALVPVARVSDGEIVARIGRAELFRLDLGAPLTVWAEGLEIPTGLLPSRVLDRSESA